jgi:hypothetical protein
MLTRSFRSLVAPLTVLAIVGSLAITLTATPAKAATPSGACVTALIETPFRLPDGSLHDAGTLTLCDAKRFSPIATLHRTYVNGRPVGMFVSRHRFGESAAAGAPGIVFHHDGAGRLDLFGYVLPSAGRNIAYQMGQRRPTLAAPVLRAVAPPETIVAAVK